MRAPREDDRDTRRRWFGVGLVGSVVSLLVLAFPHPLTERVLAALCGVALVAMMVGPVVHHATPRRVWGPMVLGAACFVVALFGPLTALHTPVGFADLCLLAGYACWLVWLAALTRRVGRPDHHEALLLDTTAVVCAAALCLWSLMFAPVSGEPDPVPALTRIAHPLVDAALLTLILQTAFRVTTIVRAHTWFIVGLGTLLVVDMAVVVRLLFVPSPDLTSWAPHLLPLLFLALGTCHPSVAALARRRLEGSARRPGGMTTALILLTMSPVVLAVLVPMSGPVDIAGRAALVTVLLGLLFVRMATTMQALDVAEVRSRRRATRDELTGLVNRAALQSSLGPLAKENASCGRSTAVLFLDCDDFKHVNDTWGHQTGDDLLVEVADRLRSFSGQVDVLARHGGDEFVIVAAVDDQEAATSFAEAVQRTFEEPLRTSTGRIHDVAFSIGVVVAGPGQDLSTEELLRRADVAMYEAKASGRGQHVLFDDALAHRDATLAAVSDRLSEAIRTDAFGLRLQPIYGGADYSFLLGWEALADWVDPELGAVPPTTLVQVAEEHGQIDQVGRLLLRRAARELARRRTAYGRDDLLMSVNISPTQLRSRDFAAHVRDTVDEAGLPPGAIWLEVTETLLVDDGPDVSATLAQLREAGVSMCLDDFGTGYASLSRLFRMPAECVKLDRSLVALIGETDDGRNQLAAVLDLLHALGVTRIVAEGVETREQAATLQELGCPMVQGWLYGRPVAASVLHPAPGAGSSSGRPTSEPVLPARPASPSTS